MTDVLTELRQALADYTPEPHRELHCGGAIRAWLMHRFGAGQSVATPWATGLIPLAGVPVIVSQDMADGAWELREEGEVVLSGQVGAGCHVFYIPETDRFMTIAMVDPAGAPLPVDVQDEAGL